MIRYEFHQDPDLTEVVVHCYAPKRDLNCLSLERYLSELNGQSLRLLGISDGENKEAKLIDLDDVFRFYSVQKQVYAELKDSVWRIKSSLCKLEELCSAKDFVRINQGELINLSHVDRLDLSLSGVIGITLKNRTRCFVSRRSLKAFKQKISL